MVGAEGPGATLTADECTTVLVPTVYIGGLAHVARNASLKQQHVTVTKDFDLAILQIFNFDIFWKRLANWALEEKIEIAVIVRCHTGVTGRHRWRLVMRERKLDQHFRKVNISWHPEHQHPGFWTRCQREQHVVSIIMNATFGTNPFEIVQKVAEPY
jgi:hypothetical protein